MASDNGEHGQPGGDEHAQQGWPPPPPPQQPPAQWAPPSDGESGERPEPEDATIARQLPVPPPQPSAFDDEGDAPTTRYGAFSPPDDAPPEGGAAEEPEAGSVDAPAATPEPSTDDDRTQAFSRSDLQFGAAPASPTQHMPPIPSPPPYDQPYGQPSYEQPGYPPPPPQQAYGQPTAYPPPQPQQQPQQQPFQQPAYPQEQYQQAPYQQGPYQTPPQQGPYQTPPQQGPYQAPPQQGHPQQGPPQQGFAPPGGPPQGYGQPGYPSEPGYPQQAYGAPPPPGYGQFGQQPPYQPYQAATAEKKKPPLVLWLALGAVVVVGVLVIVAFVAKPGFLGFKKVLDHTAVEKTIENGGYTNVKCNDGKNPEVKKGSTFTCTADGGKKVTVTITKSDGDYTWSPSS